MKISLVLENEWPFKMAVEKENGDVLFRVDRIALSTKMVSRDDLYAAVGFDSDKQEKIETIIKEQEDTLYNMVKAFNAHDDLVELARSIARDPDNSQMPSIQKAEKAIKENCLGW